MASTGTALGVTTKKVLLALSVRIDVLNSTKLKKFSFQLNKTAPAANQEEWTIMFDLFERASKTETFDTATIHVSVDVSLENVPNAEKTALADDFTVTQTQHVVTTLAAASNQFKAGQITQDEFNEVVEATVANR